VVGLVADITTLLLIVGGVTVWLVSDDSGDDRAGRTTTEPEQPRTGGEPGTPSTQSPTTRDGNPATTESPTTTEDSTATTDPDEDRDPVVVPADAPPPRRVDASTIQLPGVGPLIGALPVEVGAGEVLDIAVRLEDSSNLGIISAADDGARTTVQMWSSPDDLEASWDGGEAGMITGAEWNADEPLEGGVYVFRVISRGTSGTFELRFFGTQ
jgi:hypothetical protein